MPPLPLTPTDVRHEVELASVRIAGHVRETPCEPSPALSVESDARVNLKLENEQVTASFKARGAVNKVMALSGEDLERGLVTASVGNHALGMLYAAELVGAGCEIWISDQVSSAKMAALKGRGASLKIVEGGDPGGIEVLARRAAQESGRVYVSPYNDPQVIGGQGTIAAELVRQVGEIDVVFVPVGGGGLAAGIGGYLKEIDPGITIVGCQAANSPVVSASLAAGGGLLELPWQASLADGVVGLVEPDAITYELCRTCVDEWVLLSEAEIAVALRLLMVEHSILVEGAGALSVAAYRQTRRRWAGASAVCLVSGARISLITLAEVLRAE